MTDITTLEAEYQAAKQASDKAYAAMWKSPKDKALLEEFKTLFFKAGNARRALEAATGKYRDDLSISAQKKNLEHGAEIEKEMDKWA